MRTLLFLFLSTLGALAQGGAYCTMSTWEPRNLATKAGLVASYDFGNQATLTGNPSVAAGNGISQVLDLAMKIRTGNLLLQSEAFNTTWSRAQINAFGATDTGAAGAGSFANTARTTDPLGGNTADFIQEDSSATTTHYLSQTPGLTAGTKYTFSCWLKGDAQTLVALYAPIAAVGKCFDLTSGAINPIVALNPPTASSATAFPNSWWLCSITFTAGASEQCRLNGVTNSAGTFDTVYTGNNTKGFFAWGASLVKSDWTPVTGTSLALGYQATTTTAYAPPDLVQSTAANQPLLSRSDNAGNLLKQSESFNTTWTLTRVNAFGATDTGAAGAGSFANTSRTTDPLGGNTADFIQEDATASNSHFINQPIAVSAGSYTRAIWLKAAGRTQARLYSSIGSDTMSAIVTLTGSGTIASVSNGGSATGASGSIVESPASSGWYLCKLSSTFPTAGNISSTTFLVSGGTDNYNGDNTSGLYLWGASITPSTWTPVTGTSASLGYVVTTTVPIYAGLSGRSVAYFDGSAYYMKSAALFPLVQPEEVYLLANQLTWAANQVLFDGYVNSTGRSYKTGTTPDQKMFSGNNVIGLIDPVPGTWNVTKSVFNGASSSHTLNGNAPVTGDLGNSTAMNGLTFSANGSNGGWDNELAARALICNKVNATAEANYLAWGLKKQAAVY